LNEVALRDPERLYRELSPAVLGYLRAQGVSEPEDVLGDVFVGVVKGIDHFAGDASRLRSWVFSIAHARIVDDRRRRDRRPVVLLADTNGIADRADDTPGPSPDPALVEALAQLTPEQRDVVALRFIADLDVRDVAELIRKRPDAVRALQSRALARLATLLSDGAQRSAVR
jgi:RNA polymerase sigma-70 factor (ECF subfamily)